MKCNFRAYRPGSFEATACRPFQASHGLLFRSAGPSGGFGLRYKLSLRNMFDLSAILAGIGPPVPCNAMPDPAAVNTDFARDPMGYVNALSSNGP